MSRTSGTLTCVCARICVCSCRVQGLLETVQTLPSPHTAQNVASPLRVCTAFSGPVQCVFVGMCVHGSAKKLRLSSWVADTSGKNKCTQACWRACACAYACVNACRLLTWRKARSFTHAPLHVRYPYAAPHCQEHLHIDKPCRFCPTSFFHTCVITNEHTLLPRQIFSHLCAHMQVQIWPCDVHAHALDAHLLEGNIVFSDSSSCVASSSASLTMAFSSTLQQSTGGDSRRKKDRASAAPTVYSTFLNGSSLHACATSMCAGALVTCLCDLGTCAHTGVDMTHPRSTPGSSSVREVPEWPAGGEGRKLCLPP